MNWTQLEGKWQQVKGELKSKWGKLTDDDLTQIEGHRDVLLGKLRERYGETKDSMEDEVDKWLAGLDDKGPGSKKPTRH
jgi:uncharacterized protein YjbJ (UPF0337 family)